MDDVARVPLHVRNMLGPMGLKLVRHVERRPGISAADLVAEVYDDGVRNEASIRALVRCVNNRLMPHGLKITSRVNGRNKGYRLMRNLLVYPITPEECVRCVSDACTRYIDDGAVGGIHPLCLTYVAEFLEGAGAEAFARFIEDKDMGRSDDDGNGR